AVSNLIIPDHQADAFVSPEDPDLPASWPDQVQGPSGWIARSNGLVNVGLSLYRKLQDCSTYFYKIRNATESGQLSLLLVLVLTFNYTLIPLFIGLFSLYYHLLSSRCGVTVQLVLASGEKRGIQIDAKPDTLALVTTRLLCSSCPVVYWFAAHLITDHPKRSTGTISKENTDDRPECITNMTKRYTVFLLSEFPKPFWGQVVLSYFFLYFMIGIILYSNFLPWTEFLSLICLSRNDFFCLPASLCFTIMKLLVLDFSLLVVEAFGFMRPFLAPNLSLPSLPARTVSILASLECFLFL
ncbi:GPI mannosyltransferase 2-like, partial [Homarus americanus]